jgi:cytochrome c-type biogenesis protein
MAVTVSFSAALLAGVLSFLSPCVLPLVPGYLGFLNGLGRPTVQQGVDDEGRVQAGGRSPRLRLIIASCLFVAGFLSVFVALGATTSLAGGFIARNLGLFQIIGGALIALLGMHFLGVFTIGFLNRDMRFMPSPTHLGTVGAFIVGLAFGFGWTPCVGPVLATILMLSAGSGGASEGAGLLLAYGLGMGLPFVLVAAFADVFMSKFTMFTRHALTVKWILGGLLVLTGLAVMTGTLSQVGFWLLRNVSFFQGVG